MAAKIKEGLRDITQGMVERLKGGPKYADNLLGESLQDQLRKATAKDLLAPSEELNSQVVDTINQDIANGKDSKEIVGLLKKRLRTDNPHKQWLAVLLVGRVMKDCSGSIGLHQEELLQEVARVMTRPARPDSSSGRTTRQAAKELLRSYGRAGAGAFRAVQRAVTPIGVGGNQGASAANSEAASVVAEVEMLIEQAKANTELLSEMLLVGDQSAAGAGGQAAADEFENELTLELVTEVRELRTLFDAYLEQLQSLSGPEVEAIMLRALEAVDLLDGALALQQDVASNQREIEQQQQQQASLGVAAAATGGATAATAAGVAAGGAAGGSAAATAAPSKPAEKNLIDLDDLFSDAGAQPQQPPQPVAAGAAAAPAPAAAQPAAILDPFEALTAGMAQHQIGSPPSTQPPPAPAPATTQPPGYPQASDYPFPQQQQPPANPFAYGQPTTAVPPPYGGVYGAPPAAMSYGMPPPAAVPNPNNPFASNAVPTLPYGGGSVPLGANPFAASGPAPAMAQPMNSAPAAPPPLPSAGSHNQSMDAEWAMFFAGRTAGGQPAAGQAAQ